MSDLIDLHCHSTASDGSLTPAALVREGRTQQLKAIAITDHDTVEGAAEALAEAAKQGFELVPGIEISADVSSGTMHILGYYVDHTATKLLAALRRLQDARETRNHQIVKRLRAMDMEITYDDLLRVSEDGQVGRPHFAQVLVEKGIVRTPQEAFDMYLKKGRPAYVDKFRFDPIEAVQLIREAGGTPVLAHPSSLRKSSEGLEETISRLQRAGLDGLEVFYSEHTPEQTRYYQNLCNKFGLLATGGTDYHGSYKPDIAMGRGHGDLRIPYELLADLKKQRGRS